MFIPVFDIHTMPGLAVYAARNEAQLKHMNEPAPGIFIAETANVVLRALQSGYEPESMLLEKRFTEASTDSEDETERTVAEILTYMKEVPVYTATLDEISAVSGFKQTRGVLCAMKRRELPPLAEVLKEARRIAVLEDVENPTNVGAIFRSAAALGIDAVVLTYRCVDPLYRRASRVSMGGVFRIPWTYAGNKHAGWPGPVLDELKNAGFETVAMALSDQAVSLADPSLKNFEKLAVFFGNEETGLCEDTLRRIDHTAIIPMMHEMDSLNVAAAAAVTFWELCGSKTTEKA